MELWALFKWVLVIFCTTVLMKWLHKRLVGKDVFYCFISWKISIKHFLSLGQIFQGCQYCRLLTDRQFVYSTHRKLISLGLNRQKNFWYFLLYHLWPNQHLLTALVLRVHGYRLKSILFYEDLITHGLLHDLAKLKLANRLLKMISNLDFR